MATKSQPKEEIMTEQIMADITEEYKVGLYVTRSYDFDHVEDIRRVSALFKPTNPPQNLVFYLRGKPVLQHEREGSDGRPIKRSKVVLRGQVLKAHEATGEYRCDNVRFDTVDGFEAGSDLKRQLSDTHFTVI